MAFTLPTLPYPYDALETAIDAKTMEIHHTKHHQTYIDKLNAALEEQPSLQTQSVEELLTSLESLPESIRTAVRNHGGGHYNHSLFWELMSPDSTKPSVPFTKAIDHAFGSFDQFKQAFTQAAVGQFGSGWAWLVIDNGKLNIMATPNQDSPISQGKTPILGLDIWEHAYYLRYQNKRLDYIENWWKVVSWAKVSEHFEKTIK